VVGAAFILTGAGFARPGAEKAAAAGKPAGVDDKKADDKKADDKKADAPKPEFDPKEVRVGPPPELAALRAAVEEAARKGENVDEIRKQLESLEKALAGKAWVKPKLVEEPLPQQPVAPAFPGVQQPFPRMVPGGRNQFAPPNMPVFPGGIQPIQPNLGAISKAQEMLIEATQLLAEDPIKNGDKAAALQREAQEMMARALGGAQGQLVVPAQVDPRLGAFGANGRLGVKVERLPIAVADEAAVAPGRGVMIAEVVRGSVAEKAGLKANDVVIEFAGRPVTDDTSAFVDMVLSAKAGEKIAIVLMRKGQKETIQVELPPPLPGRRPIATVGRVPGPQLVPMAPRARVEGLPQASPIQPVPVELTPLLPPGGAKQSLSVRIVNGDFTITAERDGITVVVDGSVEGGKGVPSKIQVTDGAKKVEAKSVDKLPAEYRDRVQKILEEAKIGR
jgi:hypothetical protein